MHAQPDRLTTPMILLMAINLIPGIYLRPVWSMVFAAILVGYRLYIDRITRVSPPRWSILVGVAAAGGAVWQSYGTLFGDEPSGTLLMLLGCLKLYELKHKRDYFVAVLLCFLMLMSLLLLDQSLLLTVFLLVDVVLLLGYLQALELDNFSWRNLKPLTWPTLLLALKSLPLMVLIFLLFPRFSTGFGSGDANVGKVGVSDSLRPGSVASLIASDELVFRATFLGGALPPRNSLYWRGAVLDLSKGLDWERQQIDRTIPAPGPASEPDIEITMEPGSDRFVFTLDTTATVSLSGEMARRRVSRRDGGVFEWDRPLQTRERYFLHNAKQRVSEESDLRRYLQTSEKPSAELQAWMRTLPNGSSVKVVHEILHRLRNSGYSYSLSPPPAASLDDFLFRTKTGFCEHFAGTVATVLRYLGIPSRVVVGFQGGTPSWLDNYISVRAHDAHAWIEFYDRDEQRWRRADPTAEIDPQRILVGSDTYLQRSQRWISWMPESLRTLALRGRALFDEVDARWIGFLVQFDLNRQKDLLAKVGMEGVIFRALPLFLVLAVLLVLAFLYFFELQRRGPMTPEQALYVRLLKQMRKWKLDKRPSEGPQAWWERIRQERPDVAEAIEPVLAHLTAIRFGRETLSDSLVHDLRSRLGQLKKLSIKTSPR